MSEKIIDTPVINENQRVDFLDGLRGWASFAVLLSHIIICFLISTNFLKFDRERLFKDISEQNYIDIILLFILVSPSLYYSWSL